MRKARNNVVTSRNRKMDNVPPTIQFFDCRNYVKRNDPITFLSSYNCGSMNNVMSRGYFRSKGIVTKVYRDFVEVKMNCTTEHVNRWDIISIGTKIVKNGAFERPYDFMDSLLSPELIAADEED